MQPNYNSALWENMVSVTKILFFRGQIGLKGRAIYTSPSQQTPDTVTTPSFHPGLGRRNNFGEQASDSGEALGTEEAGPGLGVGFLLGGPHHPGHSPSVLGLSRLFCHQRTWTFLPGVNQLT